MNSNLIPVEIIEDVDDVSNEDVNEVIDKAVVIEPKKKAKRTIKPTVCLEKFYDACPDTYEIGVDEAGRGPLFGRVYSGAVILPKDDSFDHSKMKDSKKFHSVAKIIEAAEYIKEHAIAWGVGYESEQTIDNINILQATQQSMHKAISKAISRATVSRATVSNATVSNATVSNATVSKISIPQKNKNKYQLLVDGNYFKPYVSPTTNEKVPYITVEGGDNKYSAIAAASILAKVARDQYINELCEQNPYLGEYYGIDSNKGYGAKKHMEGIKEHGITVWHRRTFGICKNY
jgi:ribonuclease HII